MGTSDMQPVPPISEDLLLRHAGGMRALARGLLRDEHAAEDVVQEALLAVWQGPPGDRSRAGGWLRQVLRKRASKRLRGEARRREREHDAARGEALPATDELVAEGEILRLVVDAVLSLSEPYRSVVLLRYYGDLAPSEIARRRGAPVATVNSQLQRALALLRKRLDARAGGERGPWALALSCAIGEAPRGAPAVESPPGVVGGTGSLIGGMAMHWKFSIGLMAVFSAGWGAWKLMEPAQQVPEPAAPAVAAAHGGRAAVGLRAQDAQGGSPSATATDRTALGEQPSSGVGESEGVAQEPVLYELELLVVDEHDRPRDGITILAAPPLHPLNVLGRTGPGGRRRVTWLARGESMTLLLGLSHGEAPEHGLRAITLRAGEPARLRLVSRGPGKPSAPPRAKRTDQGAEPVESLRDLGYVQAGSAPDTGLAPLAPGDPVIALGELLWFTSPVPVDEDAAAATEGPVADDTETSLQGLGYVGEGRSASQSSVILAGHLVSASGEPMPGVLVTARMEAGGYTTRTDGQGKYEFVPRGRGRLEVLAGGGDMGLAQMQIDLDAKTLPARITWSPQLERGLEVRGTLTLGEGIDSEGWLVVFDGGPERELWQDVTLCAQGRFAIPNLPSAPGRVLFFATPFEPFPVHQIEGVVPGGEPLEVELEARGLLRGGVTVGVRAAEGAALADAQVLLLHAESGRAAYLRYDRKAKRYVSGSIPPGRYRAQVGTAALGFRDLGEFAVLPGELTRLGEAALPEPGELFLAQEVRDVSLAGGLLLQRVDAGYETMVVFRFRWAPPPTIALPPGEYALSLVAPGSTTMGASTELRIESGATTPFPAEPAEAIR